MATSTSYDNQVHAARHLVHQIRDHLRRSVYQDIRRIECHIVSNRVVLRGVVSSYFLKQVAQTVVRNQTCEAMEIVNLLEVKEARLHA